MPWGFSRVTRGVLAVVTLLFSAAGVLQAQATGIIRGRVLETGTNRPVTAAQVAVEGTRFVGLTNDQGAFSIAGVRPGTYRVTARRLGYEPRSASVAVVAGQRAPASTSRSRKRRSRSTPSSSPPSGRRPSSAPWAPRRRPCRASRSPRRSVRTS
ncbi:MAG: carboxypeptidase regulatory-like domain-containing protein [Gemmatimonadaceae bacterium]